MGCCNIMSILVLKNWLILKSKCPQKNRPFEDIWCGNALWKSTKIVIISLSDIRHERLRCRLPSERVCFFDLWLKNRPKCRKFLLNLQLSEEWLFFVNLLIFTKKKKKTFHSYNFFHTFLIPNSRTISVKWSYICREGVS